MYTKLTKEFSNKGTLLSGGELQKLAIARVYARKCNIIILDEPSSSLDPIAENEMFNSMLSLAEDRTVILISHRLANVKNVDRIFLLEDGKVIEQGTHEELMRFNGKYADMYNIQANRYTGEAANY
jgi:ATP-binding cassette subfamily B protein